jgi:hypothetical protein
MSRTSTASPRTRRSRSCPADGLRQINLNGHECAKRQCEQAGLIFVELGCGVWGEFFVLGGGVWL